MSEFDELRRLRDADPVEPSLIPSAEAPGPRALRERFMMAEPRKSWYRSRTGAIGAAAAVVLLATTMGVVLATRGTTTKPRPDGSIIQPGSAACVEQYSLTTLTNRAVAFDGTVKSVSGDDTTFSVGEWFKGGSAREVTLKGASTLGGITSAGPGVSLDPGTRLLVAGDGGFAWSCGFTQPFNRSIADDWRTTLR